jgi:hypothetical protein
VVVDEKTAHNWALRIAMAEHMRPDRRRNAGHSPGWSRDCGTQEQEHGKHAKSKRLMGEYFPSLYAKAFSAAMQNRRR